MLEAYDRQGHLNELLEQSEKDGRAKDKQIASLKDENTSLNEQILSLREELDSLKEAFTQKIDTLTAKLKGAYQSITAIIKAVRMLKYDGRDGYKVEGLTRKQDKLIDGLAAYAAQWAREDGYSEMAEDMEKHIGISKGIEKTIAPQRLHSRDDEMGL